MKKKSAFADDSIHSLNSNTTQNDLVHTSTNETFNTIQNKKENIDDINIINWSNFLSIKSISVIATEYTGVCI